MGLMRFFLALCVLVDHSPWTKTSLVPGGLAVELFFIISGFYMAMVLTEKYNNKYDFYTNRIIRLFPVYLIVLALSVVALLVFGRLAHTSPPYFSQLGADVLSWSILLISNLLIVGQDVLAWFHYDVAVDGLAFNTHPVKNSLQIFPAYRLILIVPAWSIAMELYFYALIPFILKVRNRFIILLIAASFALSLSGKLIDVSPFYWPLRLFLAQLYLFLLGVLSYRLFQQYSKRPLSRLLKVVICISLVVLIYLLSIWPIGAMARLVGGLFFAAALPFLFQISKTNMVDRHFGELSYPIYISHILVLSVVELNPLTKNTTSLLVGTLLLSAILYYFVDRKVHKYRQRRIM